MSSDHLLGSLTTPYFDLNAACCVGSSDDPRWIGLHPLDQQRANSANDGGLWLLLP